MTPLLYYQCCPKCRKMHRKTPVPESPESLSESTLLKRLWHRCFPVNFAKFLKIPFLRNTSGAKWHCSFVNSTISCHCSFSIFPVRKPEVCWILLWIMLKDGQTYINHFEVLTPQDFKGMFGHFFNIRHETVKPRNSIETQQGKFFFKRLHEDHDFTVL